MLDPTRGASLRETFRKLLKVMPKGGAFWDIGANIGWFSWYCVTCRPDFEVVSFEPDLRNLRCLRKTSEAWGMSRHEIIPRAVAEKTGRATFLVDDISGSTGSLADASPTFNEFHYGQRPRCVEVDTASLDEFLSEAARPPCIVKIDVEGAELRVLEGARDLIRNERPILFFETFERRFEISRLLGGVGYSIYDADRGQPPTSETLNFVAVPNSSEHAIVSLREIGYRT